MQQSALAISINTEAAAAHIYYKFQYFVLIIRCKIHHLFLQLINHVLSSVLSRFFFLLRKIRERERMEGGKQSASSFTSDLFGAKDTSPSSQILTSIFAPPPKVRGGESLSLSRYEKNNGYATQPSTAKTPVVGEEEKKWSKDKSCCFPEERVEAFQYSSSIFYGAQDVYSQPQAALNPDPDPTTFNKDAGEDDSGGASRGNWWQGSLYY